MIYQHALLHNIGHVHSLADSDAVRLQRVPEYVRDGLEDPARAKTLNPAGSEIRFVLNSGTARITLSSAEEIGTATFFNGTFAARDPVYRLGEDPVTIEFGMPDGDLADRFASLPAALADSLRYHPRVCRVVLRHGTIRLHGIEGDIRPPRPDELPATTMLAYGTSITHGAAASAFHLSYVAQTAWRLGTDLLNFGVGGACRAEKAFADYIAELDGWDFATLALSVNMIGAGFTLGEFRKRTKYLLGRIAGGNPDKPVFCISIYPFFGDWGRLQPNAQASPAEFRNTLEEVAGELALANLHFIPGPEILTDIGGLSVDMIHPGDYGMINMGENLATKIALVLAAG